MRNLRTTVFMRLSGQGSAGIVRHSSRLLDGVSEISRSVRQPVISAWLPSGRHRYDDRPANTS